MQASDRLRRLRHIVKSMDEVAIAYSGGVDSTLLLKVAKEELESGASAIVCSSSLMPEGEVAEAVRTAKGLGIEAKVIALDVLSRSEIIANPPDRCYHCKKLVFQEIIRAARAMDLQLVADGTHSGDQDGDRPGMRALRELGVRSPLAEAGMDKEDIRGASRELGLPTASRPPSPCLATRIPYNERITTEKLIQVDEAERLLHDLGYGQVRVRHHGTIARVEVEARFLVRAVEDREVIESGLRSLGFIYVTLDLTGFRSGSMSEALPGR
ncbi:MAG: ATP-dependent sacrificial sulfur transferase LarE [Methanomassiliicoccus sp.]|nr:ATP-dependent sacrificial sulfur transferase LarE [Methanomassiliicoccus sp.]